MNTAPLRCEPGLRLRKYNETRWHKMKETTRRDLFTLPREEFRKYAKIQCEMSDSNQ